MFSCSGGSVVEEIMFAGEMKWLLSVRRPARRPLEPMTSEVMRELVNPDDELAAVDREALWADGGRETRKPGGLRARLAVGWVLSFKVLSSDRSLFLRFDIVDENRAGRWPSKKFNNEKKSTRDLDLR